MTTSAESCWMADAALNTGRASRPTAELVHWAAAALIGLLALAAVILCWRRLDAGLSRPLELPAAAAVAAAFAALATAGRWAWQYGRPLPTARGLDRTVAAAISAAILALGAAVSLPGTSPAGLALLWGILAVEESWAWFWGPRAAARRSRGDSSPGRTRQVRVDPPARSVPHTIGAEAASQQPPGADVVQQLTRSRKPDGSESLSGWIRVPLAAGQRSTNVHVAFCPPFARTPKAALVRLDGPDARIKTVQLLPYGARFDIKLASVSQSAETLLMQLAADAEPPQQAEA